MRAGVNQGESVHSPNKSRPFPSRLRQWDTLGDRWVISHILSFSICRRANRSTGGKTDRYGGREGLQRYKQKCKSVALCQNIPLLQWISKTSSTLKSTSVHATHIYQKCSSITSTGLWQMRLFYFLTSWKACQFTSQLTTPAAEREENMSEDRLIGERNSPGSTAGPVWFSRRFKATFEKEE